MKLDAYEQKLLEGWEDVHKKGQLTLWILLALKDGAKHMQQIKDFIETITINTLTADDKSMYRALRRFHDAEMIVFEAKPSEEGPDLKVYRLTPVGKRLLAKFIDRNITAIFYDPRTQKLLSQKSLDK